MSYTSASIDRIREANIVEVVGHFVSLKKEGVNLKGLSPFKDEKTPSFVVSPVKQIFKCFSTGSGGDGIRFVMLYKNVDFIEAVKTISEICNIHLEEEDVPEEVIEKRKTLNKLKAFTTNVEKKYRELYYDLDSKHWAKKWLKDRKYSKDVLVAFGVGYTPGGIVHKAAIESGYFETSKEVGLVKVKDGLSYDFFKDRITFPIHDQKGLTLGFGARRSDDENVKKYAKYLNPPESPIYNKSRVLYGIYQARDSINKTNTAILVEGYTDVIAMHDKGFSNTVACCGTAFTIEQAKVLSKIAKKVILFMDGDAAGQAAIKKGISILLSVGLQPLVCILDEGVDPDSLCRDGAVKKYIEKNQEDALFWLAEKYAAESDKDPMQRGFAIDEIAKLLLHIEHDIIRGQYVKSVSKIFKTSLKEFKNIVDKYGQAEIKANIKTTSIHDNLGLPEGADPEQYLRDRFAIVGNSYYFSGKDGFFKGSNCKVTPLFHIAGESENKRLCEITNELNHTVLVDFESREMNSFSKFEDRLVDKGYFVFTSQTQLYHFKLLKNQILRDFIKAHELYTLGWQPEQFLAYANGVWDDGVFKEVNRYGIMQVARDGKSLTNNKKTDIKHYYSPAFSDIYKDAREGDDPYENDRYFVYNKSPISIAQWCKLMIRVYGDRGRLAVAFSVASLFRDHIMKRHGFFPHLFLSGEKGSGKSKYGDSIISLFTHKLPAFDLNSGTPVAFYSRVARLKNVPVFLEEFNDKIADVMFQGLKAAYDGRGREKGTLSTKNKTVVSKVQSSCVIAGQYLSARDDNSLTSRSIVMHFIKRNFDGEDTTDYDQLKDFENTGLSSLLTEIVAHRDYFEEFFQKQYSKNVKRFKNSLKDEEYQERMMGNYNAMFTPLELLSSKVDFGIDLEQFYNECLEGIISNSDLIIESEGLAEFWKVLEHLEKHKIILYGRDYLIETPIETSINPKKKESEVWKNTSREQVLFLRLNSVHQEYHKEVTKREGVDVIGESTLRNYFRAKKYYIGPKKSHRFDNAATSCYLFNYTLLNKQGVLNLVGNPSKEGIDIQNFSEPNIPDDTPF